MINNHKKKYSTYISNQIKADEKPNRKTFFSNKETGILKNILS